MKSFSKFLLLISIALLSSGCVVREAIVTYKYNKAMQQCDKYGGVYGSLPIVTEGVFDTSEVVPYSRDVLGRSMLFINKGLNFVEFPKEVADVSAGYPYGRKSPYFKNEYTSFNYYRAYVSNSKDPLCAAYYLYIKKNPDNFKNANLSKNQCVAVEGFDDPALLKAPYELTTTRKTIDDGIEIEWNNIEVIDRSSGKVVAGLNSFSKCLTQYVSSGFGQGKECSGGSGGYETRATCPKGKKNYSALWLEFPIQMVTFKRSE